MPDLSVVIQQRTTFQAAIAIGTTWYVDGDWGGSQTGASATPFATIQQAFDVVNPGDTVRIRTAATPYDDNHIITRSGSAGLPITIEPDVGHTPIITYTGNGAFAGAIEIWYANYITIQNLTFDGTGVYTSTNAILDYGANWANAINSDQLGIQIIGNTFLNWGRDAGETSTGYKQYETVRIGGGWEPPDNDYLPNGTVIRGNVFDGSRRLALAIVSTKNSIVEYNEFVRIKAGTQNSGSDTRSLTWHGIAIGSGTPYVGINALVQHNEFHDYDLDLDGLSQGSGGYTQMSAIHCDVGSSDGFIQDNLIYNLDPTNSRDAVTALFVEEWCFGYTFQRNIVHHIGGQAFRHDPRMAGTANSFLHNTIYECPYFHAIELRYGNVVVKNNICVNGSPSQIIVSATAVGIGGIVIDYNDWWDSATGNKVGSWNGGSVLGFAAWKTASGQDAHSINQDPDFTSSTDLTLQGSSPAIAAGEGGVNMGAI